MLLSLPVFPLLTLVISTEYFVYPFIVSKKAHFLTPISSLLICVCYLKVSRLMLDLLEANCPLDESIDSRTMETLRFRHSESDRDTETDSLRDDRRAISLGDEIYEEAG